MTKSSPELTLLSYFLVCLFVLAALGVKCCMQTLIVTSRELLFIEVHRFLTVVASLVAENRL